MVLGTRRMSEVVRVGLAQSPRPASVRPVSNRERGRGVCGGVLCGSAAVLKSVYPVLPRRVGKRGMQTGGYCVGGEADLGPQRGAWAEGTGEGGCGPAN